MTPLTWALVGNTPDAVNPRNNAALNPNGAGNAPPWGSSYASIVASWSGGAWDESRQRLTLFGGGHTDYAGNELVSIDVNAESPAWSLLSPPTGAIGNTGTLNDGSESSGVYFDGRPRSQHTYNQMVVVGDDFWVMPGGAQYISGGATKYINHFDMIAGDWGSAQLADADVYSVPFYGGGGDYDATRGVIWTGGYNNFNKYAMASKVWTRIGPLPHGWSGGYYNVKYCAQHDLVVLFAGSVGLALYDPALNSWSDMVTSGTAPTGDLGVAGIQWDQTAGRYLVWETGEDFYTLTPPVASPKTNAWTWGALAADAGNAVVPAASANGTYGRFFLSERLRIAGCINATNQQVHVFALD